MYRNALFALCALFVTFSFSSIAHAAMISTYNDTISDSAPDEYADHTIHFNTLSAIPAGGYLRFTPTDGYFTVPASNFGIRDVELYVATSSGYQLRSAAASADATNDGIAITTGTSGNITITLNSSDGISSGATVKLVIGPDSSQATSTDIGLKNPSVTGSYEMQLQSGPGDEYVYHPTVYIIENVTAGPVNTRETIPPERYNGAPTGTLSGTTQIVQLSVETNEFARCRYSQTAGTAFYSMGSTMDSKLWTVHSADVAVVASTTYTYYVRCIDDEGNINTTDYAITFTIRPVPTGTPGSSGTNESNGSASTTGTGTGSGTGSPGDTNTNPSSSGTGGGGGTGSGSGGGGSSGSGGGTGSSGAGGTGDNSGSGAGGGGGLSGSGPYQSGDGRVIINGYAFPGSGVYILVDGQQAQEVTADSKGAFTSTLDNIARGVYTFGVYAVDKTGTKSSTFSTTFTVTGSRGSTLSNVNVMPSIEVSPDPVDPGSEVTFSGYSIPNALVTIENRDNKTNALIGTYNATSSSAGSWSVTESTSGLSTGTYKVRAKSAQPDGVTTNFSGYTYYGVGQKAKLPQTSDLNQDGKVNLIDFSILLYWWNSDGGNSNPPADINQDGKVSLTDFSIMIYNWTG